MTAKTYLVTKTLETRYPILFYRSKQPRYVIFQHCRCVYHNGKSTDYVPVDIQVHADWIERDFYEDHFAGFANTNLTKYKKWQVISPKETFKIWFTDMKGEKIKTFEDYQDPYTPESPDPPPYSYIDKDGNTQYFNPSLQPKDPVTHPIHDPPDTDKYISSFLLELLLIY
jgi:hypothetical protein